MPAFFKNYKSLIHFIPGLVILVFGMFALHTSVLLMGDHQAIKKQQENNIATLFPEEQADGNLPPQILEARSIINRLLHNGVWVYWSVFAMGLAGFVLVILNADKMRRLQVVDEERKKNLSLLESRLAAMEATVDGICLIDGSCRVTYINQAFQHMFGLQEQSVEDFIGKPWIDLFCEEEGRKFKENVMPILDESGSWRGMVSLVKPDGTPAQIEMAFQRLEGDGTVGTARDMTEKIKSEHEKRDIQAQLYQAQKMEAIGRLAGGIAHDFNNILASMNGYAEFLKEDLDENSPQYEYAGNILSAGYQARALVDQILAFSRHRGSEIETMDLMEPAQESLSMLKASLPKTIEMHTDMELESVPIKGNPTQISQVIMNLCVNAQDAMEGRKGILGISVQAIKADEREGDADWVVAQEPGDNTPLSIKIEEEEEGRTRLWLGHLVRGREYAVLGISDTGTGMSKAVMEHVFEPFFTTKPVEKGTGLGLSTVHGVISAHRGALKIDSALGQGTRFELYFPLSEEEQGEQNAEEMQMINDGGQNILLVEDQDNVREMTTRMLERLGYEVATATNGLEAMDMLRKMPNYFHLVITDQNMPKMTGIELIEQAYIDHPDLPFILLSGYSEQKLQDIIQEHPSVRAILRKPIAKADLETKLAQVLGESEKDKDAA